MIFTETKFKGAFVIDIEPRVDERGFYTRAYCKNEFENAGITFEIVQENLSYSAKKGTLRGMHFQKDPYAEDKFVRCIRGSLYDVIIDLRKDSDTYCEWYAVTLSSENKRALFIPKGFAHGFLTLEDNTEFLYKVSEFYHPEVADGLCYNDSYFNITWPDMGELTIKESDLKWKPMKERIQSHE